MSSIIRGTDNFDSSTVGSISYSKSTNGYTYLPSGIIIQWGNIGALGDDGSVYVAFPIAFPNAVVSIVGTSKLTGTGGSIRASITIKTDYTKSGFTALQDTYADSGSFYIAIGY